MGGIKRRLSWREIRSWLGEHVGVLLVILVTSYLLGFFLYHTYASVDTLLWQKTARYRVGDSCALLVEYPAQLPLESSEQPGYPLLARLWHARDLASGAQASSITCLSGQALISYTVNLGPLGSGLVFTGEDGQPAPAVVELELGLTESSAIPERLYLRRAPGAGLEPVPLEVQVQALQPAGGVVPIDTLPGDRVSAVVEPETERASCRRHLLRVLFNPGPLQWVFTAVTGIVGVWEVCQDLQQRREERREKAAERRRLQGVRIEALRSMGSLDRACRAYRSLWIEFKDDDVMLGELRNAFDPAWLPCLRQHLGRYLQAGQFDQALASLDDMAWEWQQATGERTLSAIQTLLQHLQEPEGVPSPRGLYQILEGFRGVGLEATQPVVDWLEQVRPPPDLVRSVLFENGGAGGRYLLLQWAERDGDVARFLESWEQEAMPLYQWRADVDHLWPRERGESDIVRQGVRQLGLDFNPFGPEKAEQDPLLPDLFYPLSPSWQELTAPKPSLLIAPPGSGRSALIWMVRHESGLIGSSVERSFPVFLPVQAVASAQDLGDSIQQAIASALCAVLGRDPYALLGLEEAERTGLAALLLRAAGGLAPLLQQLNAAGLGAGDADGQLLQEALGVVALSRASWQGGMEWNIPRCHPYGWEYTYLLVDASCRDEEQAGLLSALLFDRWLPSLAPRHLVPKVFLSFEPDSCPITPVQISWGKDDLRHFLRNRLARAGLVLQPGRPVLDGWVEGLDDPDAALIERAQGSPGSLIRLGNRLIHRIAHPPPLARDEFLDVVLSEVRVR